MDATWNTIHQMKIKTYKIEGEGLQSLVSVFIDYLILILSQNNNKFNNMCLFQTFFSVTNTMYSMMQFFLSKS
jgi:hypothetical protein